MENQMQNADRLKDQVGEMSLRHEMRAHVCEEHLELTSERKNQAEREVQKLRLMIDVFSMGERLLHEKKAQLLQKEEGPPSKTALGGLEDAVANLVALGKQASRAVSHNEGAAAALSAMETTIQTKATAATARGRGLAVQGARAIGVAERRDEGQQAHEAA